MRQMSRVNARVLNAARYAAIFAGGLGTASAGAATYDITTDFNEPTNNGGGFQAGFLTNPGSDLSTFTPFVTPADYQVVDKNTPGLAGLGSPSGDAAIGLLTNAGVPAADIGKENNVNLDPAGIGQYRPANGVSFDPSSTNGQEVGVAWTAPFAGTYTVNVHLTGENANPNSNPTFGGASTTSYIYQSGILPGNATPLNQTNIIGYAGNPASAVQSFSSRPPFGTAPERYISATVNLLAGQQVYVLSDNGVGHVANDTSNASDTVGLGVTVTSGAPTPALTTPVQLAAIPPLAHQITFDEATLKPADNTLATNQYVTEGAIFNGLFQRPTVVGIPNSSGGQLENGSDTVHTDVFPVSSILFNAPVTEAVFALGTQAVQLNAAGNAPGTAPTVTTFTAYYQGNAVDTFTANTSFGGNNVYGFSGLFDRIDVSTNSYDRAMLIDNVTFNSLADAAVPEPASLGILAIGAVGILARRRRA